MSPARWFYTFETALHLLVEKVVEPASKPLNTEHQLTAPRTIAGVERTSSVREGPVEPPPTGHRRENIRSRESALRGGRRAQSSIPRVGDEGIPISRASMRPAR